MKKFFSFKVNKTNIDRKLNKFSRENKISIGILKSKSYIYWILGLSFPVLYIYYIMKASGLFKSIEADKKYKERQKKMENKHNVDMEKNNQMLKEFDEKWEINKPLNDYENKMKYGNKDLNKREETETKDEIQETMILEKNEPKEEYEQIKFVEEDQNIDATKLTTNIIFDSRLDIKK